MYLLLSQSHSNISKLLILLKFKWDLRHLSSQKGAHFLHREYTVGPDTGLQKAAPLAVLRVPRLKVEVLVTQPDLTFCPLGSSPWNSPVKNTGGGCYFLLQGLFPIQGLNPGLLAFIGGVFTV